MKKLALLVIALCALQAGCRGSGDMAAAEANGVARITEVSEFVSLYPDALHFISYYSGTKGDPAWTSHVGIHGRYILHMKFKIDFDATRTQPSRISDAEFFLLEVSSVEARAGSGTNISYGKTQKRFGLDKWKELLKAKGDLSVLGIEVIPDKPVQNFDTAWPSA